jgi:hypothetical protein
VTGYCGCRLSWLSRALAGWLAGSETGWLPVSGTVPAE